jgi:hypothetical protein
MLLLLLLLLLEGKMQNAAEPKHVYCTQDINPHLAQP